MFEVPLYGVKLAPSRRSADFVYSRSEQCIEINTALTLHVKVGITELWDV